VAPRNVPKRLTDDEWTELQTEAYGDTFRLMILGFSAVEAEMDHWTEQLFRTPQNIRDVSSQFRGRLTIAAALGVVRDYLVAPLEALSAVRNRLAHGTVHEVSDADVRRIRDAFTKAGILFQVQPGKTSREDLRAASAGSPSDMVIHTELKDPWFLISTALTVARLLIRRAGEDELQRKRDADEVLATGDVSAIVNQLSKMPSPSGGAAIPPAPPREPNR
jgi:hypothetical protein